MIYVVEIPHDRRARVFTYFNEHEYDQSLLIRLANAHNWHWQHFSQDALVMSFGDEIPPEAMAIVGTVVFAVVGLT